jgi:hypothetical protein
MVRLGQLCDTHHNDLLSKIRLLRSHGHQDRAALLDDVVLQGLSDRSDIPIGELRPQSPREV